MGRKIARESAMKLLYQMEVNDDFSQDAMNIFYENNKLRSDERLYVDEVVKGVISNIEKIDEVIEQNSQGWKIKRIAKVDLSILRISIFEIMFKSEIPYQVSINEAINISKEYSTNDSSKFINGLLGAFSNNWIRDNK
ncbi:N utilization substance protein B-like protein [Gottschalkia acidurici 9a]|uniref:Transcription antitermination protein NusB n=1 Tax=Gottschalkia acidurici (strain ATCC 7906 / DSM 604 / BCRC 14475 / CIP 104303 / KCTC 5404 / NCIMB 10678 / 9a) TaxID=1128398 RepID=K0AX89_GOTA9|nr:transcription antitermination factor NusB [Gottschalkia acidurici]AFS78393.1 N utilization substance protein B-like protein [Gottschalkia acidurici 9a]